MASSNNHPEVKQQKESATESVDHLIGKNHAEKQAKVSESVSRKRSGTQEEISEVMAGAEKPSEKVSERAGEKGEGKGPVKRKQTTSDEGDQTGDFQFTLKDYHFPSEIVMVQKIRTAIKAQIKLELRKAKKFQGQLGNGGVDGYNKSIARVRSLKEMLTSLYTSTVGFLKNMYVKYFTPDGKRRKIDEVQ